MDAGHFKRRSLNGTRYDRRNVNPQCRLCNRGKDGMQYEYGCYLVKRYGEGVIDELNRLANAGRKFTIPELREMIKEFRKEAKKY